MAALAQNRDGLRADQAGAADNDDLHGLQSSSPAVKSCTGFPLISLAVEQLVHVVPRRSSRDTVFMGLRTA